MIRKEDQHYYSERLRVEREAVTEAACPSAKTAHQQLADRYADLLASHAGKRRAGA